MSTATPDQEDPTLGAHIGVMVARKRDTAPTHRNSRLKAILRRIADSIAVAGDVLGGIGGF